MAQGPARHKSSLSWKGSLHPCHPHDVARAFVLLCVVFSFLFVIYLLIILYYSFNDLFSVAVPEPKLREDPPARGLWPYCATCTSYRLWANPARRYGRVRHSYLSLQQLRHQMSSTTLTTTVTSRFLLKSRMSKSESNLPRNSSCMKATQKMTWGKFITLMKKVFQRSQSVSEKKGETRSDQKPKSSQEAH